MNQNKSIKEIAEQAKQSALDAMIKITDKEQALKVYSESYDTKFAELIVRKCISEVAMMGVVHYENPDISWAVNLIIGNLKETFELDKLKEKNSTTCPATQLNLVKVIV